MPVYLAPRPIHCISLGIPSPQTRVLMPRNPAPLHQPLSQSMTQMMSTATLVKKIFQSFP